MPELPDIESYRITLTEHLVGARVRDVRVLDAGVLRNETPNAFRNRLVGCRFGAPHRHGKWLMLPADGLMLLIHSGMTGKLYLTGADGAEVRTDDRLVIVTDAGELRYADLRKLGGLWLLPSGADVSTVTGDQGVDALGISVPAFRAALLGRRGALKTTLMDQQVIAGLGNMLTDEVCWRAQLHPARTVNTLDDQTLGNLHRVMQRVLRAAVKYGRIPRTRAWLSSTRDRDPAPCPRCATALRRSRIGGRTSIWCPHCQPPSTTSGADAGPGGPS